jgi:alanyl-tRNA synthetase
MYFLQKLATSCKTLKYKKLVKFYSSSNNNHFVYKWTTDQIRKQYIDYFCLKQNHKFLPSNSVLPQKGSGTYFTNSGMNQFKAIILGELKANEIIDFNKYHGVANSQKCIRIGGKHSDLDEIGKDTYHHTFFEMLGNWSFGKSYAFNLTTTLIY